MCGIFGHTLIEGVSPERSRAALHTLAHRGPDQWGEWRDERVYLGHHRLSILDLSEHGRQPMTDRDESVLLTINGEIYGFQRLRNELAAKHEFRSGSDSEVALHGYKEWGIPGLLDRIDGMYAFCLYDRGTGKVFLVRDRAGIKPLYYAKLGQTFAWASELKALRAFFGENRLRPDGTALYDFLTYLYVPSPKTLYQDVYKLEPAHYVELDLATSLFKPRRYWQPRATPVPISEPEAARSLVALVDESVKDQLVSDVPVGVFLSGGMDSSAVTASAVRCSQHIKTFNIRIADPSLDESRFAQVAAEFLGTDHHVRECGAEDAEVWLARIQSWYDEPFGDTSAIPTHLVSRFSRERITVALSGDGGDELFGGYMWYEWMMERQKTGRARGQVLRPWTAKAKKWLGTGWAGRLWRRAEFEFVLDDLEVYTRLMGGLLKDDKIAYARLWNIDPDYDDYWHFRRYWEPDLPLQTRLQWLDFHTYLPDDILTKVDRASMQVALEVRVPLLSRAIIEFVFSLPESIRYAGGHLKGLMKKAFEGRLPPEILSRRKQGFSIPLRNWNISDKKGLPSLPERILRQDYRPFINALAG